MDLAFVTYGSDLRVDGWILSGRTDPWELVAAVSLQARWETGLCYYIAVWSVLTT